MSVRIFTLFASFMLTYMENSLPSVLKITSNLNGAKAIDGLTGEIASAEELR